MHALLDRFKSIVAYRPRGPAEMTPPRTSAPGAQHSFSIEVDAHGSPVSVPEADWLICFVPGLNRQWWHCFAHARHKHVFAMRAIDDASWLLMEPWWTRMMVSVLTLDEAVKFLRWGNAGNILKVRESIPGRGSQARGWANCSVLISYMLGRSYWTWTPHGLYRRLAAEAAAEPIDLSRFLAEHFRLVAGRNALAFEHHARSRDESLDEELQRLGMAVMTAMMSASAIGLYKTAVAESTRFAEAARALRTFGPECAIGCVRTVLDQACRRGEAEIDDCALAAHQFASMLRGDLHLEIVVGLRALPSASEMRAHVVSVVRLFLRGACRSRDGEVGRNSTRDEARLESRAIPER